MSMLLLLLCVCLLRPLEATFLRALGLASDGGCGCSAPSFTPSFAPSCDCAPSYQPVYQQPSCDPCGSSSSIGFSPRYSLSPSYQSPSISYASNVIGVLDSSNTISYMPTAAIASQPIASAPVYNIPRTPVRFIRVPIFMRYSELQKTQNNPLPYIDSPKTSQQFITAYLPTPYTGVTQQLSSGSYVQKPQTDTQYGEEEEDGFLNRAIQSQIQTHPRLGRPQSHRAVHQLKQQRQSSSSSYFQEPQVDDFTKVQPPPPPPPPFRSVASFERGSEYVEVPTEAPINVAPAEEYSEAPSTDEVDVSVGYAPRARKLRRLRRIFN